MPDDVSLIGTAHMQQARGGWFNRAAGRGTTSNVSASLKFDIPGLKDFKKQLDDINTSLKQLDQSFAKLAKAPEAFSKSLENAVKQMKLLQSQQVQGNRYVTQGTPPSRDPIGQATAAAQAAGGGGAGGGGIGGGASAGGGGGAKVGEMVTKGIEAMMKRFDSNMQSAIAADVYNTRMAVYQATPTTGAGIVRNQGKNGYGFMATDMVQGAQVQYMGTGIGAYIGAAGRPGQYGAAYQQSIKQMQEIMPGLDATQGAAAQQAIYGNVQGIKMGRALLGADASPFKNDGTGERKTQSEYFRGIFSALQRQPRTGGKTGNWTKEDIMKQNFPGSRLNIWLATILPDEAIPMWYEWALNNAAVGGNLSDDPNQAKKQLEQVRGRSLATNAQETTNREAQREATFAGEQYGAMNARLDYEKQMLGVLQHIDTMLSGIYGIFGRVPSLLQGPVAKGLGAVAGGLFGGVMSLLGGDPGYMPMGDPEGSTSHLTPDLRARVDKMMSANPNLKISSSYRGTRRQQSLQGKGPFAPAGKSEHGKGRAVDFGTQLGWVAKNAKKFGLETAARYGEPWHVQLAGTLNMGDPVGPDPSATARENERALQGSLVSALFASWRQSASSSPSSSTGTGGAGTAAGGSGAPGALNLGEGAMTAEQVVQTLYNAGFRGDALVTMAGIANRESGWTPTAHRSTQDLSKMVGDLGLLQINYTNVPALIKAGIISSNADLLDPNKNAAAAYFLAKGGSNLAPWTAGQGGWVEGGDPFYGVKQSALDAAKAAAQSLGYIGDVGYAPQAGNSGSTISSVSGGNNFHFHNTFQLSFPNGASRTSIDTATRQIASRLEIQMNSVVSRNN